MSVHPLVIIIITVVIGILPVSTFLWTPSFSHKTCFFLILKYSQKTPETNIETFKQLIENGIRKINVFWCNKFWNSCIIFSSYSYFLGFFADPLDAWISETVAAKCFLFHFSSNFWKHLFYFHWILKGFLLYILSPSRGEQGLQFQKHSVWKACVDARVSVGPNWGLPGGIWLSLDCYFTLSKARFSWATNVPFFS